MMVRMEINADLEEYYYEIDTEAGISDDPADWPTDDD
jgi:hypothetical protein